MSQVETVNQIGFPLKSFVLYILFLSIFLLVFFLVFLLISLLGCIFEGPLIVCQVEAIEEHAKVILINLFTANNFHVG